MGLPTDIGDNLGHLSLGLSEGIILLLDVDILTFLSKLDNIKYHLNYYICRHNNWWTISIKRTEEITQYKVQFTLIRMFKN